MKCFPRNLPLFETISHVIFRLNASQSLCILAALSSKAGSDEALNYPTPYGNHVRENIIKSFSILKRTGCKAFFINFVFMNLINFLWERCVREFRFLYARSRDKEVSGQVSRRISFCDISAVGSASFMWVLNQKRSWKWDKIRDFQYKIFR